MNLRDVHKWVAAGLAETSWLTYADMATGCGAEEVLIHDVAHDLGREDTSRPARRWFPVLETWTQKGMRGHAPGTGEKAPRVYTHRERVTGPPNARSRDYGIRKAEYLLRPEVSGLALLF
jgi:hypothetical protein